MISRRLDELDVEPFPEVNRSFDSDDEFMIFRATWHGPLYESRGAGSKCRQSCFALRRAVSS